MAILRMALSIAGILVMVIGLIWIGQGSGLFPYPASSFMINQTPWIFRGAVVTVAGVFILWAARRFLGR